MSNEDFIYQRQFEFSGGSPDWDSARAQVKLVGHSDIVDTNLGPAIDGLFDSLAIGDAVDPDAELVRQAIEILSHDVDACEKLWGNPESAQEVGGMPGAERNGDAIIIRGPQYPDAREDYETPYWRFTRALSSGAVREAGFDMTSGPVVLDISDKG